MLDPQTDYSLHSSANYALDTRLPTLDSKGRPRNMKIYGNRLYTRMHISRYWTVLGKADPQWDMHKTESVSEFICITS